MMMDIFLITLVDLPPKIRLRTEQISTRYVYFITPYGVTFLIYVCNYLFGFILNFHVYMYACKLIQRNKSKP